MSGRRAKQLRRQALRMATDQRGLQVAGLTVYYPKGSSRAIYQRFKKEYRS